MAGVYMEVLLRRLAFWLARELNKTAGEAEVYLYSLRLLANSFLAYLAISLVAFPLGVWKLALVAALTTSSLRIFSGGAHASSSGNCILSGALVFPVLGLLARFSGIESPRVMFALGLLAWLLALFWVHLYAPADTPGKPLLEAVQKAKLKTFSYLILVTWLILFMSFILRVTSGYDPALTLASILGLLWQGFSLTPDGYLFVSQVDSILKILGGRKKDV